MNKRKYQTETVRDPRFRFANKEAGRVLNLSNLQKFNGNFPIFQLPRCIGSFSLDTERNYHNDFSQLRYLSLPQGDKVPDQTGWKVKFDLSKGIEDAVEKDENLVNHRMLDDLLTWILQERTAANPMLVDLQKPLRPLQIDFVCFRGLLTMLITTPYENQESWTILATKLHDTIYLWDLKDKKRKNWNGNNNPRMKEMSLWGFKFEQYLCTDGPESVPNPDQQLNTNPEFCCVLKTKLAGHCMLYGAEVDALKPSCQLPFESLENFVELKTTRLIETERQHTSFRRFKSMKWWAQSFIVGIPEIMVGYRDDDGVVSRLESMDVKQLRKESDDYWKSNIGMNFCQHFLEFVGDSLPAKSDPTAHYLFEFDPKSKIIVFRKENGEITRNLLPPWYTEAMKSSVDQVPRVHQ